jgi:hypothetical protein
MNAGRVAITLLSRPPERQQFEDTPLTKTEQQTPRYVKPNAQEPRSHHPAPSFAAFATTHPRNLVNPISPSWWQDCGQSSWSVHPSTSSGHGSSSSIETQAFSPVSVPGMAQSLRPSKPAKPMPRRSQKRPNSVRHSELFAMSAGRPAPPPARTIRRPRRKLVETEKV